MRLYTFGGGGGGGGGGSSQLSNDLAASVLAQSNFSGVSGQIGAFYLADPFGTNSLATSTGSTYDAANDWYTTEGGDTATQSSTTENASANLSSGGYIAQSFQVSTTNQIAALEVKTDVGGDNSAYTLTIEADSAGAPSGVALATASVNLPASTVVKGTLASPYTPAAGTTYWLTVRRTAAAAVNSLLRYNTSGAYASGNFRSTSAGNLPAADLYFRVFQTAPNTNATWEPNPQTLLVADPSSLTGYFLFDPVDTVSFGTDVIGYLSPDNNGNQIEGTWEQVGIINTNYQLWRLTASMGVVTGAQIAYSVQTFNNKAIRFKQSVGSVPEYPA